MSFCLECAEMPYAMCVSETRVDLTPFVLGERSRALTVRFRFDSESAAKTQINLYYTASFEEGGEATQLRRYFPLLGVGDQPGDYTRTFLPEHTCFSTNTEVDCQGETSTCRHCRTSDSCGVAVGRDCDALNFVSAQLQLAADWSACDGEFRGTVTIEELSYGPSSCGAN